MEIPVNEHELPAAIQCPECEHDIPVDPDWQEEDTFTCPNCSIELQVTSVEPLWVDFAPEEDDSWDEGDEMETLSLDEMDELEEMEEEEIEEEEEDEEGWGDGIPNLRSARFRQPARREAPEVTAEEPVLLTPEGVARLKEELDNLVNVRLPKVTAWLSDALADGFEEEDVTELEEARSELSLIEGRIRKLQTLLASAEVLEEPESKDVVQIGSRVTIVESDVEEPETYRIVSPAEADPLAGYISHVSPLGRALIGHRVGDVVTVNTPQGQIEFRIEEIG
jgi:transcription elongation factor GreA